MSEERIEGYASALFQVAKAEGNLAEVEDELFRFSRILEGNDELRSTLTDAIVPPERRQAIVEDLLGGKASATTTALVSFVVGSGRARDLPSIVGRLVTLAAAEHNKVVAEVRSVTDLDQATRERLAAAIGKATGKQVEVKVVVDPSVIGGIIATVGDTVIDGSVRRRLDLIKDQFSASA